MNSPLPVRTYTTTQEKESFMNKTFFLPHQRTSLFFFLFAQLYFATHIKWSEESGNFDVPQMEKMVNGSKGKILQHNTLLMTRGIAPLVANVLCSLSLCYYRTFETKDFFSSPLTYSVAAIILRAHAATIHTSTVHMQRI